MSAWVTLCRQSVTPLARLLGSNTSMKFGRAILLILLTCSLASCSPASKPSATPPLRGGPSPTGARVSLTGGLLPCGTAGSPTPSQYVAGTVDLYVVVSINKSVLLDTVKLNAQQAFQFTIGPGTYQLYGFPQGEFLQATATVKVLATQKQITVNLQPTGC